MKTKIIADSSCDLFCMEGIAFSSVPLTVFTDERSFTDDETLDVGEMLRYLSTYKGRSGTACPNIEDWLNTYADAEQIYVVTMSGNISGTYDTARSAAELYREAHPNASIRVFDTKSAGPQVRMTVDHLAKLVRAGTDFQTVCSLIDEELKRSRTFFALESFHNFAQNGRVGKAAAMFGSALGIRVMATASKQGTIEIIRKCRGEKSVLEGFLDELQNAGYDGTDCYIAHCQNEPLAQRLAEAIRERYPQASVTLHETRGLCSYYAEKGGILLSCMCR